jgi:hypothetical protein
MRVTSSDRPSFALACSLEALRRVTISGAKHLRDLARR